MSLAPSDTVSVEDLLTLIGQQVRYQQQSCEVVELLEDRQLVLQVLADESHIQASQYGEGHRMVPNTYMIAVFDQAGEFDAEFVAAGLPTLLGH